MKEMVGGCCVCSDERGWPENPLVYCDGQNCTVAVHQACYGIVTVPTGPWFCRKCESQERSARVRCELCPSRDGALKRTDTQSWAHVVCALYIPEVRFGNVTTMEPIILQLIPQERFSKVCYICQDIGKGSKANIGACMQCNKSGCKQQFHVTCAQALGLLCEEAGNYLDNVKYCGYCQHHYSKLKKGGNVKTIPPYKPVNAAHEIGSSDPSSSPEKETDSVPSSLNLVSNYPAAKIILPASLSSSSSNHSTNQSSQPIQTTSTSSSKQRKTGSSSNSNSVSNPQSTSSASSSSSSKQQNSQSNSGCNVIGPSANVNASANSFNADIPTSNSIDGNVKEKSSKSTSKIVTSSKGSSKESREKQHSKCVKSHSKDTAPSNEFDSLNVTNSEITASTIVSNSSTSSTKDNLGQKFTTSNFTETVVVNSDSVFGSDNAKPPLSTVQTTTTNAPPLVKKRKLDSGKSTNLSVDEINRDIIKDVSVTLVPLPFDKVDTSETKKQKSSDSTTQLQNIHISGVGLSSNGVNIHKSEASPLQTTVTTSAVSLVVSVPLSATSTLPGVNLGASTNATLNSLHQVQTIKSFGGNTESQSNSIINNRINNPPNINLNQHQESREKDQSHSIDKSSTIIRNPSPLPNTNKISMISENKSKNLSSQQSQSQPQSQPQQPSQSTPFAEISTSNSNSSATITTMESGGIKITYDKQTNAKASSIQDDSLGRMTSTPEDNSNSFSDLKITFEAQTHSYDTPTITPRPDIKHSPPSSPGSEIDALKRNHTNVTNDTKGMKIFQKGVHATHMLGNQLNPASSVAQKMSDQLYMELEAHSVYTSSSLDSGAPIIGPIFPGKQLSNARNSAPTQPQGPSLSSMLGGTGTPSANGNTPQSLEQLLERQWEQGSQFLMEQAQHFDIASLLSCLHQLRSENIRLEEHVTNLVARRDHLLAVNARLAIPLNQLPQISNPAQASFNNLHLNGSAEPTSRRNHHLK